MLAFLIDSTVLYTLCFPSIPLPTSCPLSSILSLSFQPLQYWLPFQNYSAIFLIDPLSSFPLSGLIPYHSCCPLHLPLVDIFLITPALFTYTPSLHDLVTLLLPLLFTLAPSFHIHFWLHLTLLKSYFLNSYPFCHISLFISLTLLHFSIFFCFFLSLPITF